MSNHWSAGFCKYNNFLCTKYKNGGSKSLNLYLFSFRNHGDFHEDCINIMKDLIKLMDPKYIEVWGKFTPRGGISIDPQPQIMGKKGTKWEEIAFNPMANYDLYPKRVDNR